MVQSGHKTIFCNHTPQWYSLTYNARQLSAIIFTQFMCFIHLASLLKQSHNPCIAFLFPTSFLKQSHFYSVQCGTIRAHNGLRLVLPFFISIDQNYSPSECTISFDLVLASGESTTLTSTTASKLKIKNQKRTLNQWLRGQLISKDNATTHLNEPILQLSFFFLKIWNYVILGSSTSEHTCRSSQLIAKTHCYPGFLPAIQAEDTDTLTRCLYQ